MTKEIYIAGKMKSATTEGILADSSQIQQTEEQTVEQAINNLNSETTKSSQDIVNLNKNTGINGYEEFSTTKEYKAGTTVLKDGLLYTFTTDHAAGAWNDEEVENGSLKKCLEKQGSFFFKNKILNQFVKELYLYGSSFDKTKKYYVRSIVKDYSEGNSYAISVADYETDTPSGWITLGNNNYCKGEFNNYCIEAILNWNAITDKQIIFSKYDSIISENAFNIEYSPYIYSLSYKKSTDDSILDINTKIAKGNVSNNYLINSVIKELYFTDGFDNSKQYRIYAIAKNEDSVGYAVTFKEVETQESTGWITLEKNNGYQKSSNSKGFAIEIIIDWSQIEDGLKIFDTTKEEFTLNNPFNIYISPCIYAINNIPEVSDISNLKYLSYRGINLFDFGKKGYYLDTRGNEAINEQCVVSMLTKVNEGDVIFYNGNYNTSKSLYAIWGFSDENKKGGIKVLGWDKNNFHSKKITIPSGVNYIQAWSNNSLNPFLYIKTDSLQLENNLNIGGENADFSSIYSAIKDIQDSSDESNIFNLNIHEGTYDIISDYFGENDYTDTSDVGIILPDNVNLIGIGDRDKIVLKAEFPSTIKYRTSQYFSPINLRGRNNILKNITVTAFNCRYPIHDQIELNSPDTNIYTHSFINCRFIHKGYDEGATGSTVAVSDENNTTQYRWNSCIALGQGTCGDATIRLLNCELIAQGISGCPFLTHDAKEDGAIGADIQIDNCKFKQTNSNYTIQISSLGKNYQNYIRINNCKFEASNAMIKGLISGAGYNESFIYIISGNIGNTTVDLPDGYDDYNWTV